MPGVAQAQVNLATERARVAFDPTAADAQALVDAVGKIGYGPAPSPPRTITPNARPRPATPRPAA